MKNLKEIEELRNLYKKGTKIKLIKMHGEENMKTGMIGIVDFVDDIGQIHMNWDNGSSLALNEDVDDFSIMND